ncbi:hypothetical protein DXG01_004688 [Tephrocybe rancida]|nr:hypothetical protein DXG01_004688 [Tephrocybe rancida]
MPFDPRLEPIERYRILVIGRANAGKTTLLKRVCNSTEDPCIYDENGKNLLKETVAVSTVLFLIQVTLLILLINSAEITTSITPLPFATARSSSFMTLLALKQAISIRFK